VEAAHIGRRGLGQKSSDREAIPLCSAHHREQHRIGLKQFERTYELDIPALVEALNEKPRLFVERMTSPDGGRNGERYWFASYRDEIFKLLPARDDEAYLYESIQLATYLAREYLIEQVFTSSLRPPRRVSRGSRVSK